MARSWVLLLFVLGACASTPPRDMVVRIPAPQVTDPGRVHVSDTRAAGAKEARPDPEIRQFVYLGDSAIDPPPVVLLTRYLAGAGDASTTKLAIELVRFEVGLSTSAVRDIYSRSPPLFVIGGAPAGATALGIVGQLLVAAFQGGANQSVVVNLEVRVGTESVTVTDFGFLYSGRSISEAVETILPRALTTLSNKLAEAARPPAVERAPNR